MLAIKKLVIFAKAKRCLGTIEIAPPLLPEQVSVCADMGELKLGNSSQKVRNHCIPSGSMGVAPLIRYGRQGIATP